MPELPDLEIFVRNLAPRVVGLPITDVVVHRPKRVRNRPDERYPVGRRICDVSRDGKAVRFELDDDRSFTVHLMLSGAFFYEPAEELETVKKRTIDLFLGRHVFGVADRQGLAIVDFAPGNTNVPDALSANFSLDYFLAQVARRPAVAVKAMLMDQDVVRGIGNAYSDEILYNAGVSPMSVCGKIPLERLREVHAEVRHTLRWAIRELERAAPEALGGKPREFLRVHRKDVDHTAKGEPIRIAPFGQRKTFFTDGQLLFS